MDISTKLILLGNSFLVVLIENKLNCKINIYKIIENDKLKILRIKIKSLMIAKMKMNIIRKVKMYQIFIIKYINEYKKL